MAETDIERKTATIMVADIVGSSGSASPGEDWAIRALGDVRKIVEEVVTRRDGRIFGTGGNGIQAEFTSPVAAVRCAVDFQGTVRSHNLSQPPDRQLRFRIGINHGDVMVRGADRLGDGVDVAARLAELAEPGGICVSGAVRDRIDGKLLIGHVDIGEQPLKSIAPPVRAHHLRVGGEAGATAPPSGPAGDASSAAKRRMPAVKILGGVALLLIVAGAAWQLWPKPSPTPGGTAPQPSAPVAATPPAPSRPRPPAPAGPSATPIVIPPATQPPAPPPAAPALAPTPTSAAQAPAPNPAPSPAAAAVPPKIFRDCPNCPEMVVVSPGSFQMGAAPGENTRYQVPSTQAGRGTPQHEVTIAKPFALGKFDVTRAEFAAFAAATNFRPRPGCQTMVGNNWMPQPQASWEDPGFSQTDHDPVVCMSESEIGAYLSWLRQSTGKDYRLPSEAEWEYAERGGTTTAFYWGDEPKDACDYENVGDESYGAKYGIKAPIPCKDGFPDLAPVGSFKPNPFGLYDMAGNIFVITADCWNENYAGAPTDGSAWTTGDCTRHPVRKAAFSDHHPWMFRSANREAASNIVRRNRFGFRVALSLP